ncbi:nucleotidyltransferase family protein [Marinovum sp.]|uniref:nucleotidyltransferase family protein n=1 Tax=Marinovum sp. TaxID=2024839 RepID=UPI002B2754C7|nr:nucleotidyltransferase family protein [Marinovum sp.]
MRPVLILPAAGRSSRMRGADKLLEEVDGQPCLRTMALRGLAAGLSVLVTLPGPDHPRALALAETPVQRVVVPGAAEGMAASLRAAVASLPEGTEAALILPPDMPDIRSADLLSLIAAGDARPEALIVQATTEDGTPGHPILFRRALFEAFRHLSGDTGARAILQAHRDRLRLVALPGTRARLDLDTPEAWAAWRASRETEPGPGAP